MRKKASILTLTFMLIFTISICHAEPYNVKIHMTPYGPSQLLIVNKQGDIVLMYKPPSETFPIKLASGKYYIYAEKIEDNTLYVGYTEITVFQNTEIDLVLSPLTALPHEKAEIKFYNGVKRIRGITFSGYILFEASSPQIVQIPRIPLLIEISSETGIKYFFYDPEYGFKDFLSLVEEKTVIAGEKNDAYKPTFAVLESERSASQLYDLERKKLNIMSIIFWTTIVLLAALAIFIISRKQLSR